MIKKDVINPFFLKGYHGGSYFCDREEELRRLEECFTQGIDVTLLSIRRMGKTGLIHHFFNKINNDKSKICIYFDVYASQNLADFTNQLASAIMQKLPKKNKITQQFTDFLRGFSPVVSFNPFNGNPEITLKHSDVSQNEKSLYSLFQFLESLDKKIVIAIDEFQQVAMYPEKNTEAILRTIMQNLKNTNFIFCGSNNHLLTEIFNSTKRPFFASTQTIYLDTIPKSKYAQFIVQNFNKHKKDITNEAVDFILDWTRTHTYYTQSLCNKLFYNSTSKIVLKDVLRACEMILLEQEGIYFQYRNLLTSSQWNLLTAIAKEDKVTQPTSFEFVSKYSLGNASSVRRSLLSLIEKEMLIEISLQDDHFYMVYDCFLSRWLSQIN